MDTVGFLQNRNGVSNGYLRRCLYSMSLLADQICVYDDASDEDVTPLYKEFGCTVVWGTVHSFHRELFHKQELLQATVRYNPDWIFWIDSDAVPGAFFQDRAKVEEVLTSASEQGFVRLFLHNLNLWRSPWWYRTDCNFNDLWHCVWWRNTGQLHYLPKPGLHRAQYPLAFTDPNMQAKVDAAPTHFDEETAKLLHFGFANEVEIARKYFTYRAQGQIGGRLNRLVSEGEMVNPYTEKTEQFTLEPVPSKWFPQWLLDEIGEPEAAPEPVFSPEQMDEYPGFSEWMEDYKGR